MTADTQGGALGSEVRCTEALWGAHSSGSSFVSRLGHQGPPGTSAREGIRASGAGLCHSGAPVPPGGLCSYLPTPWTPPAAPSFVPNASRHPRSLLMSWFQASTQPHTLKPGQEGSPSSLTFQVLLTWLVLPSQSPHSVLLLVLTATPPGVSSQVFVSPSVQVHS